MLLNVKNVGITLSLKHEVEIALNFLFIMKHSTFVKKKKKKTKFTQELTSFRQYNPQSKEENGTIRMWIF